MTHDSDMSGWTPLTGFEGLYEITRTGRVRSLDRISVCAKQTRSLKGKELVLGGRTHTTLYKGGEKFIINLIDLLRAQFGENHVRPTTLTSHEIKTIMKKTWHPVWWEGRVCKICPMAVGFMAPCNKCPMWPKLIEAYRHRGLK